MAVLTNIPNNTSARDWRDTVNALIKRIAALEAAGVPVETPAPAFTTQPSISPTSGTAGSTVYAATPGTVSNGSVVSRAWLLNGTAISTGVTAFPASSGTLAYQETASGPGGTTTSTVQVAAVTAATVTPTPAPSFTSQPSISPNTGTAGTTTFTATAGNVSNGSITARSWTINGTVISTGITAAPASSGTLTYQETATGPGGTTQSTVQQVTVATAAVAAPAFTAQPTISPSTGTAGTTTYTATPGAVSNGTITSRAWALNGSTISTGLTATPASAGTLTYQEFATGSGGSASSSVLTRTVSAATPTLILSPASLSIASSAAAGTTISNITNVPAGVTPSVTPNDGRLVIAGDATAGWKVVRGMTALSQGTLNFSVAATGATGASGVLTVTAAETGELFSAYKLDAAKSSFVDYLSFERVYSDYNGPLFKLRTFDGVDYDCVSIADGRAKVGVKPARVVGMYGQNSGLLTDAQPGGLPAFRSVENLWGAGLSLQGFSLPLANAAMLSGVSGMTLMAAYADVPYQAAGTADYAWVGSGTVATNARADIRQSTGAKTLILGGRRMDANGAAYGSTTTTAFKNGFAVAATFDASSRAMTAYFAGSETPAYSALVYPTGQATFEATTPLSLGLGTRSATSGALIRNSVFFEGGFLKDTMVSAPARAAIFARQAAIDAVINGSVKEISDGGYTGWTFPMGVNLGAVTIMATVAATGQQTVSEIDNTTGEKTKTAVISNKYGGTDDHKMPAAIKTPGNALLFSFAGHGTAAEVGRKRVASLDIANMTSGDGTITTGLRATTAYSQLVAMGTDIYDFHRIDNQWSGFKSTDDGLTFDTVERQVISGAKQMYCRFIRMSDTKFRMFSQYNAGLSGMSFGVSEWDLTTGTVSGAAGAPAVNMTTAPGTPRMQEDVVYISPIDPAMRKDVLGVTPDGNGVCSQWSNNDGSNNQYYYSSIAPGADPMVATNWINTLITAHGPNPPSGWLGRCELSQEPGLSFPRVFATVTDGTTSRIEQWDATNARGTAWAKTKTLRSGPGDQNQVVWRPYSPQNASPNVPVIWQEGWYQDYTAYFTKLKWRG